jgi:hypothetical protein
VGIYFWNGCTEVTCGPHGKERSMTSTTAPPTTASSSPTAGRLRIADLVILSVGTFILGVDGFVLAGLLPQVAGSLHVSASTAG